MNRITRNKDFNTFRESFKQTFQNFLDNDKRATELKSIYSLYIFNHTPQSIRDHRGVICYFGKRTYETVFRNQTQTNLAEEGSSFYIEKRDDGYVTIRLFPAKADSYQQKEDFIILKKKLNPKHLKSKLILKKYWYYFLAYMEVTSLDGLPSLTQRIIVNYLKYSKPLIINKKYSISRIRKHFLDISRFALTVGLSGFILFLLTLFDNRNQQNELKLFRLDFNEKIDSLRIELLNYKSNQNLNFEMLENIINRNSDSTNLKFNLHLKNDSVMRNRIEKLIKNTSRNNSKQQQLLNPKVR